MESPATAVQRITYHRPRSFADKRCRHADRLFQNFKTTHPHRKSPTCHRHASRATGETHRMTLEARCRVVATRHTESNLRWPIAVNSMAPELGVAYRPRSKTPSKAKHLPGEAHSYAQP